jgi:acetone carboxylase gamma subunit
MRTRIGDVMVLDRGEGAPGSDSASDPAHPEIRCARCDHLYGPADRDPKLGSVVREGTIGELSALNEYGLTEALVVRHFHCPQCGLTIAVDLQEKGDPIILGNRLLTEREEIA